MRIALITAGGAGMFCGSCMHDNTLARGLIAAGHDVSLIPTYTPIRVDEKNVSTDRVFLGGINVYLDSVIPYWNRLPRLVTRWFDTKFVLRLATRFAGGTSARNLGKLTVALLQGDHGPQSREIAELVRFLSQELRPDVICFSNALLAGVLPQLRQSYSGTIACLLQGDDIFLDDLIEPYRTSALRLLRGHARLFDRCLVHSEYYGDHMANLLELDPRKLRVVPLGIDLAGHDGEPRAASSQPFTIGYLARVCPEKGLHLLVDAFRIVHREYPDTRLVVAGYLGTRDQAYFEDLRKRAADLGAAFHYAGSPAGLTEKVAFLKTLDLFSVPTTYREPKGISILEALANGVPVVQPRHGAFPEMLAATQGGLLFEPDDAEDLARNLATLITDSGRRFELGQQGFQAVRQKYNIPRMVEKTVHALT